jgi:protein TonB
MTIEYGRKIKNGLFIGIACAVALHAVMILFGGVFIKSSHKKYSAPQQVELFSQEQDMVVEEKPKEQPVEENEKSSEETPELQAASLSDIEAELSGQAAVGGDFAAALSFSSSGRIVGKVGTGDSDQNLDKAFSLSEIDQKPRVVFQAAPTYPSGMQKIEGVVSVLFVVDQTGKVSNPRIEKATHREFEKPAIDAVKQWKFEPAIKAGQRVSCRMRIPIRFQPK